jgi:hypothetical protein
MTYTPSSLASLVKRAAEARASTFRERNLKWTVLPDPPDRSKHSAHLAVIGENTIGQLTVWETGECELLVLQVVDRAPLLNQTIRVDEPGDLVAPLDELLRAMSSTK